MRYWDRVYFSSIGSEVVEDGDGWERAMDIHVIWTVGRGDRKSGEMEDRWWNIECYYLS